MDIIGGSLGGLSTAIALKKHDKKIKVVVHEKHKQIGFNIDGRRCGEAHSIEQGYQHWKPPAKGVFNTIKKAELIIGDKTHNIHRLPNTSWILNRQAFIAHLGVTVEKLGGIIQTDDKIKSIDDLDGDYIVDASGCPSFIRKKLGLNRGIKGIAYQQTLEQANCFDPEVIKIIFAGSFGYYWIFPRDPKKKELNVGVGVIGKYRCNLKKTLEAFKDQYNINGKINYSIGGMVPLGLQRPLHYRNILFVGDAGVGTFPLNGQGVYRALISGEIAGECIVCKHPEKYPYLINQEFIKWDVIGKVFIYMNYVSRRINPNLVLALWNILLKLCMKSAENNVSFIY